jgi:hypothetical protein
MNNKIESIWYTNTEEGIMVWLRYYVDENAVLWFNYKDVCEKVGIYGRKAFGMYKDLSEECRHVFWDLNNDNNKNNHYETPFITEEGIRIIESKVAEKFGAIYKVIPNIKQEATLTDNYRIKTEKDVMKEFICDAIDKDALIDFTVDEQLLRNTIDYEYNEDKHVKMCKKELPEGEGKITKYKKHMIQESTCPSWLKDVIK